MERPSNKELFGKLRNAKAAVRNEDVFLIDPYVIAEDAIELGYDIGSELLAVLGELLEETSVSHYGGFRPPQRSYKSEIEGLELFPFVVDSRRFKCRVYFKFTLSRGSLWLVSLHQDRPIEE
jgi:hypothetical protein